MQLPCRYCGNLVTVEPYAVEMLQDAEKIIRAKKWRDLAQSEVIGCPPPSSCYRRWQRELEAKCKKERTIQNAQLVQKVKQRGFDVLE